MLWLLLAQVAASTDNSEASKPKAIFTMDDYPLAAVRNHWEGTAIAELTVSNGGEVSACRIVRTTGYKVLDDATCNLLTRRARFKPASDANGNAIESTVRTPPINWRLP